MKMKRTFELFLFFCMTIGGLPALCSGETFRIYECTGYCPCKICCDQYAALGLGRKTASGKPLLALMDTGFVAGPKTMKFGTALSIPGYKSGRFVRCEDRGGAIREGRLDLFFKTHREARIWGRRWVMVRVK